MTKVPVSTEVVVMMPKQPFATLIQNQAHFIRYERNHHGFQNMLEMRRAIFMKNRKCRVKFVHHQKTGKVTMSMDAQYAIYNRVKKVNAIS